MNIFILLAVMPIVHSDLFITPPFKSKKDIIKYICVNSPDEECRVECEKEDCSESEATDGLNVTVSLKSLQYFLLYFDH